MRVPLQNALENAYMAVYREMHWNIYPFAEMTR